MTWHEYDKTKYSLLKRTHFHILDFLNPAIFLYKVFFKKEYIWYKILTDMPYRKSWGGRIIYVNLLNDAHDAWHAEVCNYDEDHRNEREYEFDVNYYERYVEFPISFQKLVLKLGIFKSHSELKGAGLDKVKLKKNGNYFNFKSKNTELFVYKFE